MTTGILVYKVGASAYGSNSNLGSVNTPESYPDCSALLEDGNLKLIFTESTELRAYYPRGNWHHFDVVEFTQFDEDDDE